MIQDARDPSEDDGYVAFGFFDSLGDGAYSLATLFAPAFHAAPLASLDSMGSHRHSSAFGTP